MQRLFKRKVSADTNWSAFELRQAYVIFVASISFSALMLLFIPLYFYLDVVHLLYQIILISIFAAVPAFVLYSSKNLELAKNLSILFIFAITTLWQYSYGGFAPNLAVAPIALIPLCFFLLGHKKGWIIAGLFILTCAAFFILHKLDFPFPERPPDYTSDPMRSIFTGIITCMFLVTIFSNIFVRSIDYAKKIEKDLQTLQVKQDFLFQMSHELRTPLNSVTGISDVLKEKHPEISEVEYLVQASNELTHLINDVLTLSKLEVSHIKAVPISNNLYASINSVIKDSKYLLSNRKLKLDTDLKIPGENMFFDRTILQQILRNMISFSAKHANENTKISLHVNHENNFLACKVNWEGKQLSDDYVAEVLRKKSNVNIDSQELIEGKKLGLGIEAYLAKELLKILNGKLKLYNIEKGGVLSFEIKLLNDNSSNKVKLNNNKSVSILLAEDDKSNQVVTKLLLSRLGYNVKVVENGKMALDAIKQYRGNYDLVLMDIQMPVMDGIVATEKIKSFYPGQKIVAYSANTTYEQEYDKFKFDGFISKPINLERLEVLVDSQVKESE